MRLARLFESGPLLRIDLMRSVGFGCFCDSNRRVSCAEIPRGNLSGGLPVCLRGASPLIVLLRCFRPSRNLELFQRFSDGPPNLSSRPTAVRDCKWKPEARTPNIGFAGLSGNSAEASERDV